MINLYAHTDMSGKLYPQYVSVNLDRGVVRLTVRAPGTQAVPFGPVECGPSASIEMGREEFAQMIQQLFHRLTQ